MRTHLTLATARRSLVRICCVCGMLLSFIALSLAPSLAQAKLGPADDRIDHCNWNHPGVNPFMGDVVGAVDRYPDIPAAVRERLKQRMRERNFDEFVTITRDSISGKQQYDARISDMHFGSGRVCSQVSRSGWSADMKERGMVYCEQGHCILVPTVCRNVSRIARTAATAGGGAAAAGAPAGNPALGTPPDTVAANQSTPYEELRPGSGNSIDGTRASIPSGDSPAPGWIAAGAGPLIIAADRSPVFSSNPGINPRTGPETTPDAPATLSPVPEPESWGMMLTGLALLAFMAGRKRQA